MRTQTTQNPYTTFKIYYDRKRRKMRELKKLVDEHWSLPDGAIAHVFNHGNSVHLSYEGQEAVHTLNEYSKFFEIMLCKNMKFSEEQHFGSLVKYYYEFE